MNIQRGGGVAVAYSGQVIHIQINAFFMVFISYKGSKTQRGQRQKSQGPLWRQHSPMEATKLVKEAVIRQEEMLSILHPQTWLSSYEVDATSFYIA